MKLVKYIFIPAVITLACQVGGKMTCAMEEFVLTKHNDKTVFTKIRN